jgi:plastocyanin
VHSKNTIFKLAQIRISATKTLKFDRTSGSKQHNINFHVFFDYTAGKTCFLSPRPAWWCTNEAASESIWTVDSRNTIFKPAQIHISATKASKFDRKSGSKQHNINFQVFFYYTAGKTCFLSPRTA